MEGKQLVQRLTLRNFLSYGSEGASIELLPLNVLIGPNASGKSNLIEALVVLRAASGDLAAALREGGGIQEYFWKGADSSDVATIRAEVVEEDTGLFGENDVLHYGLAFSQARLRPLVIEEVIESPGKELGSGVTQPRQSYYRYENGIARIRQRIVDQQGDETSVVREISREDLLLDRSILAQRKDPELYPELTYLSEKFGAIAVYEEWTFGRRTPVRSARPADLPTDFLLSDAQNLVLILHDLLQRTDTEQRLIEYLRRFYQPVQRLRTKIQGGTVELFIDEGLGDLVPAARLSDGTLRYLSLLAILLHPSPPPLVCIEEPELGLHPDIMPTIAELLRDASQRTQLVVTTHSDALVSALSEVPETIVVCEPGPDGTHLRRLDGGALADWLDRYSLGEIWRMGEIGGTRW